MRKGFASFIIVGAVGVQSVALGNMSNQHQVSVNSFTSRKQMTKFSSANFQKILSQSYTILRIQKLESKQCRSR